MTKAMSVILTALNLCDLGATAKLGWYKNRPSRQRGSIIHLSPPPSPNPVSPLRRQGLCKNVGVKTCIMGNVKILHSLSHTTSRPTFPPLLHFFILHFSYFLPSFCAIYVGCQTIKWYAPCS